MLLCQLNY
ncbi:hypothetical protein CP01DC11_1187A, partial [Chlamydia psittaci 01DC11]